MQLTLIIGLRHGDKMASELKAVCICKGSIIKGYEHSRLGYYYLLLMSERHEELSNALLTDMNPCPVHTEGRHEPT